MVGRPSLSRNLIVLLSASVILSLGQEMWFGFVPEFLRTLGAGVLTLGLFGSLQDFFKAIYYYPGGWLTDRFGLKQTLVVATLAAGLGYSIYLLSPHFTVVFLGLPLVMIWPTFVTPALFKLLSDDHPNPNSGFAISAVINKVPLLIAPVFGGALISIFNVGLGVRIGLGLTIVACGLILLLQGFGYQPTQPASQLPSPFALWQGLNGGLKRLLVSEVLVRYAEALPRTLIVLYALKNLGTPALGFGFMLATEAAAAIFVNGPLRRVVVAIGPKPILLASFLLTALFPLSVFYAPGWGWLFGSFVIAGLKASGAVTRDTLINSLLTSQHKGQQLGLYESLLSLAVLPAGFIGGGLWLFVGAWSAFWLAFLSGLAGCALYALVGPTARLQDQ